MHAWMILFTWSVVTSPLVFAHDAGPEPTNRREGGIRHTPLTDEVARFDVPALAQYFQRSPEITLFISRRLHVSLDQEDDARFIDDVRALLGALNAEQKVAVGTLARARALDPELTNHPRSRELAQRLLWSIEEDLGKPRGNSPLENRFKSIFAEKKQNRSREDAMGAEELRRNYNAEELVRRMHSDPRGVGARMAEKLGWKDIQGTLHLDIIRPGNTGITSVALGKTPEEITHALSHPTFFSHAKLAPISPAETAPRRRHVQIDPSNEIRDIPSGVIPPEHRFLCELGTAPATSVTPSHRPVYFFRPFPESTLAGYAGSDLQNRLIDLRTGREIGEVPGPYDPVPTPDELYLTVPKHKENKGLTFYTTSSLKEGKPNKVFVDEKMPGVYQSIGKRRDSGDYRVLIADQQDLYFRDYRITAKPGMVGAQVEPIQENRVPVCPGFKLATPMISKDGSQLAALDLDTQTTKVFALQDSGRCTEVVDLGMHTGKVDFSYQENGRYLAFHKYGYLPEKPTDYIDVPGDRLVGNVYVYDKQTGDISRLTDNTDSNAVYPAWRANGTLSYLSHPHGATTNPDEKSTIVTVRFDPQTGSPLNFFNPQPPEVQARRTALGGLWNQVCSSEAGQMDKEAAALATLNLDSERCRFLVEHHWENFRERVGDNQKLKGMNLADVTEANLLALCDTLKEPPRAKASPSAATTQGGAVFRRCNSCHADNMQIPFDDPAAVASLRPRSPFSTSSTLAEEIRRRIALPEGHRQRMPPENQTPLSQEERDDLEIFLGRL